MCLGATLDLFILLRSVGLTFSGLFLFCRIRWRFNCLHFLWFLSVSVNISDPPPIWLFEYQILPYPPSADGSCSCRPSSQPQLNHCDTGSTLILLQLYYFTLPGDFEGLILLLLDQNLIASDNNGLYLFLQLLLLFTNGVVFLADGCEVDMRRVFLNILGDLGFMAQFWEIPTGEWDVIVSKIISGTSTWWIYWWNLRWEA